MRKSVLAVLLLFVLGAIATAHGQTTYTTTQNECGGKSNMFCILDVVNESGTPSTVAIDNRNNYENLYPNGWGNGAVHGLYSGFVSNPDGTQNDFYGTATFVSDDGKVTGTFNFHAHYVRVCSGRACGGTLGWHYVVLAGSTVEVQ